MAYKLSATELFVAFHRLDEFPADLPATLERIVCSSTRLKVIPSMPTHLFPKLKEFDCSYNQLTALPEIIPDTVEEIICFNNNLTTLPNTLPLSLKNYLVTKIIWRRCPTHYPIH